jgi:hypothetical protein
MLQYYFLNRMHECKDRCDDRGGGNADWRNPTVRESDVIDCVGKRVEVTADGSSVANYNDYICFHPICCLNLDCYRLYHIVLSL